MVSWDTRSLDLHTKPYDPALGTLSLVKLFGQDPQLSQLGPEALSVFGNYLEYVQVEAGRQVIGCVLAPGGFHDPDGRPGPIRGEAQY